MKNTRKRVGDGGLKIPVPQVRFLPWALVSAGIPPELHHSVLPVCCHSAGSQSRNSPHGECVCRRRADQGRCDLRLLARIIAKVSIGGSCWLWTAARSADGYGRVQVCGRHVGAHRELYRLLRGPIGAGLEADHLCEQRECVNPWHLELVTHAENVRRANRERTFVAFLFDPPLENSADTPPGSTIPKPPCGSIGTM